MQRKVEKSVATLQTKFGRDRAGNNMKRYAGQLLNDSLRDFDATLNFNKANDGLFTIDEVKRLWTSRSWSGKKAGNPLVVRGGYNCRHQWSYVNPDWYDKQGELIT